MPDPTTPNGSDGVTALDIRRYLSMLETERGLALSEGLGDVPAYMADLAEELEQTRRLYATAAVTEIATLRAELFGAQVG
jgi:hypothetical protein